MNECYCLNRINSHSRGGMCKQTLLMFACLSVYVCMRITHSMHGLLLALGLQICQRAQAYFRRSKNVNGFFFLEGEKLLKPFKVAAVAAAANFGPAEKSLFLKLISLANQDGRDKKFLFSTPSFNLI